MTGHREGKAAVTVFRRPYARLGSDFEMIPASYLERESLACIIPVAVTSSTLDRPAASGSE